MKAVVAALRNLLPRRATRSRSTPAVAVNVSWRTRPRIPTPLRGRSSSTYQLCGIDVAATELDAAVATIVAAAQERRSLQVHLCNTYTLSLVDADKELRGALDMSDLNLPDGAPVAWCGVRNGTRGPVRGPALAYEVAKAGENAGIRHYLYGGAPGVAEDMAVRLRRDVPNVAIVGAEAPPYRRITDEELRELAARVRDSGADTIWIGLGTPQQDHLVPRLAALVDTAVVPVGAAFDFIAGRVAEAPRFLHGTGLEWLYRLAREPSRLWGRYLLGGPRFLIIAARSWWHGRA